jgi:hypothetical protein
MIIIMIIMIMNRITWEDNLLPLTMRLFILRSLGVALAGEMAVEARPSRKRDILYFMLAAES